MTIPTYLPYFIAAGTARLAHTNVDGSLRVEGVCPCSQPSRSPHIALTVGIFVLRALGFLDERAIKALLCLKLEGAQPG
jgi:hypothetical protein